MIRKSTNSLEANEKEISFIERVVQGMESYQPVCFKDGQVSHISGETSEFVMMDTCKVYESFSSLRVVENAAAEKQKYNNRDLNLTIAASRMQELNPNNHLEATLASQMLAVDALISKLVFAAIENGQSDQSRDMKISQITKLQRTFIRQTEAFQKLRSSGKPAVSVENVTVNAGGQAIVGVMNKNLDEA